MRRNRPRRLVIAADALELAEPRLREALRAPLDAVAALFASVATERLSPDGLAAWSEYQQILQSREAWETIRDWLDAVNPALSFEVSDRYVTARSVTDEQVVAAQAGRDAVIARMNAVFGDGATVVGLPTTVGAGAAAGAGGFGAAYPASPQRGPDFGGGEHRPAADQPAPGGGGRAARGPVAAGGLRH